MLDPAGMRDMRGLIRDLGERGHTVLLSSLLGEVQQLCDRVGVISGGRLLAESTVDDLLGQAGLLVQAERWTRPRVPGAAGRRRECRRGRRRLPAADRAGAGGRSAAPWPRLR